jgi:hypothetical protein
MMKIGPNTYLTGRAALDQAWDTYDVNLPDFITEEQILQIKNRKGR